MKSGVISFNELPEEIILHIFSFLNPKELLLHAGLLSQISRRLAQDPLLWKQAILRYFPYLPKTKPTDYENDPKALFAKEYARYANEFETLTDKKLLLSALYGEIEKIAAAELDDEMKQRLIVLSVANNLMAASSTLDAAIKMQAFKIAAENSYFPVIKLLITQATPKDKGRALKRAAKHGLDELVQFLLTHKIHSWQKRRAFQAAAKNGYFNVVQLLLTQTVNKISPIDNESYFTFREAAKNGHYDVVQLLLTQMGDKESGFKGIALGDAARNGHYDVVQLLLPQTEDKICAGYQRSALRDALANGHHEVAQLLLNEIGHELTFAQLNNAIGFFAACKFYAFSAANKAKNIILDTFGLGKRKRHEEEKAQDPSSTNQEERSEDEEDSLRPVKRRRLNTSSETVTSTTAMECDEPVSALTFSDSQDASAIKPGKRKYVEEEKEMKEEATKSSSEEEKESKERSVKRRRRS